MQMIVDVTDKEVQRYQRFVKKFDGDVSLDVIAMTRSAYSGANLSILLKVVAMLPSSHRLMIQS